MQVGVDEKTGLASLPENMRWRVEEGAYGFFVLYLDLARTGVGPRTLWTEVAEMELYPNDELSPQALILEASKVMYRRWRRWAEMKLVVGVYPPNSIWGE